MKKYNKWSCEHLLNISTMTVTVFGPVGGHHDKCNRLASCLHIWSWSSLLWSYCDGDSACKALILMLCEKERASCLAKYKIQLISQSKEAYTALRVCCLAYPPMPVTGKSLCELPSHSEDLNTGSVGSFQPWDLWVPTGLLHSWLSLTKRT